MKRFALVLTAAGLLQLGAMGKPPPQDFVPERAGNTDSVSSLQDALAEVVPRGASNPSPADQAALCYLVREGPGEGHTACQHWLSRRNFNANPFGLRFGKRAWTDRSRSGSGKLLPYLLYLRDVGLPA